MDAMRPHLFEPLIYTCIHSIGLSWRGGSSRILVSKMSCCAEALMELCSADGFTAVCRCSSSLLVRGHGEKRSRLEQHRSALPIFSIHESQSDSNSVCAMTTMRSSCVCSPCCGSVDSKIFALQLPHVKSSVYGSL